MEDLEADDCGCPFGKTGAKAQGRLQSGQQGKEPCDHRKDAQQCIGCCLDKFLHRLSPDYSSSSLPAICTSLSGSAASRTLWNLYWCDSRYCGVWIDPNNGTGQDPNVDLIINKCQNIGHPSIIDPGPPPPDYTCSRWAAQHSTQPCQDVVSTTSSGTPVTAATVPTQLQTANHSSAPATPTPEISGSASTASMPSGQSQPTDISAGIKATIGLCSALGVFFLLCLALVCWRRARDRRKRPQSGDLKAHIRHHHHHGRLPSRSRDSPTPLITPTHSASGGLSPLTPPLRLRDRKLLPSILKPSGGRSSSPPLTSLSPPRSPAQASRDDQFSFPGSPICKPTTNKLVPRHEQAAKFYGLPMPPSTASSGPRSSISSCAASGSTTANSSLRHEMAAVASHATASGAAATTVNNSSSSAPTPPLSPTRPQRPHEEALQIPDLVTPAAAPPPTSLPVGPPPKRALPVPPISPTSPTSSGAPGRAVSELGEESHDIRELTKEYAREHRESWSSWTTGGGGPGVTVSPVRGKSGTGGGTFKLKTLLPEVRRATAAASGDEEAPTSLPPLLHGDDLASLGGRY